MRMTFLAVAVPLLALGACRPPSDPEKLTISIAVDPSTFRTGTEATVSVTVTNRGDRPVLAEAHPCPDPFVVTTLAGVVVGPGNRICLSIGSPPVEIPAGAQRTYSLRWNGNAPGASATSNTLLPPGDYLLRARVMVGGRIRGSDPAAVTLTP